MKITLEFDTKDLDKGALDGLHELQKEPKYALWSIANYRRTNEHKFTYLQKATEFDIKIKETITKLKDVQSVLSDTLNISIVELNEIIDFLEKE